MRRISLLLVLGLALSACASAPEKVDYVGCGPRTLFWAFGPKAEQPFLDVCQTELDISEAIQYFNFVPITGINQDTGQAIDANHDGVSSDGNYRSGVLHWGGDSCRQYARRIVQKQCEQLGSASRTGGCEWIAIQVTPKTNIDVKEAYVTFSPVAHVRLNTGEEKDNYLRPLTTGFKNCQ